MNIKTSISILIATALALTSLPGFVQARPGEAKNRTQVERGQKDIDRDRLRDRDRRIEPSRDRDRDQDRTHAEQLVAQHREEMQARAKLQGVEIEEAQ